MSKRVFGLMLVASCTTPTSNHHMTQNDSGTDGPTESKACVKHEDCASSVCLPNGSCADSAVVAYVDSTGTDNASCMQALPCVSLQTALATPQPIIKMIGTVNENVKINDRDVTLFASKGTKLASATPGAVIEIAGSSQVSIFDLQITGATGPVGDGILVQPGKVTVSLERVTLSKNALLALYIGAGSRMTVTNSTIDGNATGINIDGGTLSANQTTISSSNVGSGINVLKGGIATLTESTISNNQGEGVNVYQGSSLNIVHSTVSNNHGEGLYSSASTLNVKLSTIQDNGKTTGSLALGLTSFDSAVTVVQSTIVGNGDGGIGVTTPTQFHITNNFIIRNGSSASFGAGITIRAESSTTGELRFNTVADNQMAPDFVNRTAGIECKGGFSAPSNLIIGNSGGQSNPPTVGDCDFSKSVLNPSANPGFKSTTDYHLTAATSDIILNAAGCAGNNVDIDDQSRPNGTACDIGADEYTP